MGIITWIEIGFRHTDATYNRISQYLSELDTLGTLFLGSGIQLVVLKNGGIARGIFDCVGCCPMGDLDVLVEKINFSCAHKLLSDYGYILSNKNMLDDASFDLATKNGVAEYSKILSDKSSLWFELHWRSVTGRWIRPDQEPIAEILLARSIPIPGTAVRLLSPEDNLIQVALHTARHSYVRPPGFRLHTDVDRIVNYQKIDWDIFLQRVFSLQVKTPVYFSLLIPKELFGTPIPEFVLTRLQTASTGRNRS